MMTRFSSLILGVFLTFFLSANAWAVPGLSDDDKQQLDGATDLTPDVDGPSWYPLLKNADQWQANDRGDALVPEYESIMAQPRQSRGKLYLITGLRGAAADQSPKWFNMAIPGTWEGHMERWTVITDRDADKIVIVYLTKPPAKTPAAGDSLRIPGRFYKVLSYVDLNNKPRTALVFVGAYANVGANTLNPIGEFHTATQLPAVMLSIVIIVLFIFFMRMRKRFGKAISGGEGLEARYKREREEHEEKKKEPEAQTAETAAPLPTDPIEALAELERRRNAMKDERALEKKATEPRD